MVLLGASDITAGIAPRVLSDSDLGGCFKKNGTGALLVTTDTKRKQLCYTCIQNNPILIYILRNIFEVLFIRHIVMAILKDNLCIHPKTS